MSDRPRALLPVLFSVVVLDLIGFGVVIPVLPFYAREFGANGFVLGALLTSYAVMQFLLAPVWGRMSDRVGRRPVMLICIAGVGGSLALLGLADSLFWLFVARILGGAFGANIGVATAYVADVTDPSERTRWMGMIGASFAVGFLVGPALGGLLSPDRTEAGLRFLLLGPAFEQMLSPFGYGLPMLFAAGLAVLNFVYAFGVLREPHEHRDRELPTLDRRSVLRLPVVGRVCAIYLLFSAAVTQLEVVFAFLMMDRFDYGARDVAWILVAMATVMGAIQGGGMRALAGRFGERTLLRTGLVMLAIGLAGIPYATPVSVLLIPLALCAVGRAISHPPMLSLVSASVSESQRGAAMGTFQASASLARVVGPLAAGALYDVWFVAPFLLATALLVAAAWAAVSLPSERVGSDTEPALR